MTKIDSIVLIKPHSTWKKRKITQAKKKNYPKQIKKVNPSAKKKKFPQKRKKKWIPVQKIKKTPQKTDISKDRPLPPPFFAIFFPTYKHENRSYFDPVLTTPLPGGGVLGMHLGKCELSSAGEKL